MDQDIGVHGIVDSCMVLVRGHNSWAHESTMVHHAGVSMGNSWHIYLPPCLPRHTPLRWNFSSLGFHSTRLHQNSATALTTSQPPASRKNCRSWGARGWTEAMARTVAVWPQCPPWTSNAPSDAIPGCPKQDWTQTEGQGWGAYLASPHLGGVVVQLEGQHHCPIDVDLLGSIDVLRADLQA